MSNRKPAVPESTVIYQENWQKVKSEGSPGVQ